MWLYKRLSSSTTKGFTLIELLVVIGIVAILATVVVLTINPAELLRQARDSTRISDLNALNKALAIFQVESFSSLGNASTTYVSIADTSATCANLGLPPLPSGYSYACVASSSLRNVNGTGWIPVNLTQISVGSPIGTLPVDPINTTSSGYFYTYNPGSWEFNASMESKKQLLSASKDGGDSIKYEVGSKLTNSLFKNSLTFNEFPTTVAKSGDLGWFKNGGTGSVSLGSDSEGPYLRANGYVWYEYQENIPFNPNVLYKISCKVRQVTDPTVGGKGTYCGIVGVSGNKTTYLNITGQDNWGNQHYVAAAGHSLTAGVGYTTFTGYFKGHGTPAGGHSPNKSNPAELYPGIEYFRPMFILNYDSGNGVSDIQFEIVEVDE